MRVEGLPEGAPLYLRPKGDQVAVLRAKAEDKVGRAKMIYAPATAKEAPYEGVILAKGPKVQDLEVGEYILFSRWPGVDGPVIVPTDHVIMLKEEDVITAIDKPAYDSYVEAARRREEDARKKREEERAAQVAEIEAEREKTRAALTAAQEAAHGSTERASPILHDKLPGIR